MKHFIVQGIIIVVIIAALVAILFPIFAQSRPHDHRPRALPTIKQLGTAIIIYATDNNERFSHATALPGLRASIFPYCKNNSQFQPTFQSSAPEFNFNYAGVTFTQIPMGYQEQLEPDQTSLWYALCTIKDQPGVFRSRIDGSAKFSKLEPFFETFQHQFDRTDITLAPTDYLADQDPLAAIPPTNPSQDEGNAGAGGGR